MKRILNHLACDSASRLPTVQKQLSKFTPTNFPWESKYDQISSSIFKNKKKLKRQIRLLVRTVKYTVVKCSLLHPIHGSLDEWTVDIPALRASTQVEDMVARCSIRIRITGFDHISNQCYCFLKWMKYAQSN